MALITPGFFLFLGGGEPRSLRFPLVSGFISCKTHSKISVPRHHGCHCRSWQKCPGVKAMVHPVTSWLELLVESVLQFFIEHGKSKSIIVLKHGLRKNEKNIRKHLKCMKITPGWSDVMWKQKKKTCPSMDKDNKTNLTFIPSPLTFPNIVWFIIVWW